MKKVLCIILGLSLGISLCVPFTGIIIHKIVGCLFFLLVIIHLFKYRKKMDLSKWLLFFLLLILLASGIFAYIYNIEILVAIHQILGIVFLMLIAIHFYIFHRRLLFRKKEINNEN